MKQCYCFLITLFTVMLLPFNIHAQRCYTDEKMQPILDQNEAYERDLDAVQKHLKANAQLRSMQMVITIPVHVILIHDPSEGIGQGDNLSLEHVQSQITVLNEDFRRTNADAVNTPAAFAADDSMIEFCLASIDPDGQPTDGITRYPTTQNFDANEFSIKQETGWPRENYLNIWVDPDLNFLGYAYLPGTGNLPNAVLDGVVCRTSAFGGEGFATSFNYGLGRTCTHEVGHYLGLRHIWRSGGCGADDGFDDTPLQNGSNFGCPNHPSPSCGNDGDMFMNYMDYVDDDCMNSFSTEQGDYMRLILNTSRASLLTAANTACTDFVEVLSVSADDIADATCFEGENGSVILNGSGGVPPYTYSIDGINFFTDNEFTDLSAGQYVGVIQDDDGTQIEVLFDILEPEMITIATIEQVLPSCFGSGDGSIELNVEGGIGPYTFMLDGFDENSTLLTGLSAGNYTFEVIDNNDCIAILDLEIGEPEELIFVEETVIELGCDGELAEILVATEGGIGEILYSIDGGDFDFIGEFSNLDAGNYEIIAQDENGCQTETFITIDEFIEIEFEVEQTIDVSCSGAEDGLILIGVISENEGLTYSINGSEFQNDQQFEDLPAGEYELEVMDLNGCTSSLTTEIFAPDPIVLETEAINTSCFNFSDGQINVMASGGTGLLEFSLDGTIYDDTEAFTDLTPGEYQVSAKDENGCFDSLFVEVQSPDEIIIETELDQPICFGGAEGEINIVGFGGSGTFQYSIDGFSFFSESSFSNLVANNYHAFVQDDNGCIDSMLVELVEPDEIIMTTQLTQPRCFGGTDGEIIVDASGGTGSLQFSIDGNTFVAESIFSNLGASSYQVSTQDGNGCIQISEVELEAPEALATANLQEFRATCPGENSGSVTFEIFGGILPYLVSNPNITDLNLSDNLVQIDQLGPGDYPLIITDANGCTAEINATINALNDFIVQNLGIVAQTNQQLGSIQFNLAGGTPPYEFALDGVNFQPLATFPDLLAGAYSILARDANGCLYTLDVNVPDNTTTSTSEEWINQIEIRPNPVSDLLQISSTDLQSEDIDIRLISLNGQVVYGSTLQGDIHSIPVSHLANGIYLLELKSGDQFGIKKIAVHR